MLAQIFYLNGPECPQAGMQRDFRKTDPFDLQPLDQFNAEVEARCWCSYRSLMFRIHRLVSDPVLLIRFAPDQFGKRSLSKTGQHRLEFLLGSVKQETNGASPGCGIVDHLRDQFIRIPKIEFVAHPNLSGRINNDIPKAILLVQFSQQKHLDPGTCLFLPPIHAGWEDLGIVDDEHILVVEILHDIPEMTVLDLSGSTVDNHHPGILPLFDGILSNKIKGKIESEL